eukprot:c5047_g1_i1.p1 GENE.c5047_g1_i1~~c5047_g1_i1.p1  ORF type:complete len:145 (+),score=33.74 c5047_g1_i1:54-488(+)
MKASRALSFARLLIRMPRLSPSMTSGTICKQFVQQGQSIEPGNLICEIATKSLTEDSNDKTEYIMQIESHESGFFGTWFVDLGKEVKVGTPMASMTEHENDVELLTRTPLSEMEIDKTIRVFAWQAYLKPGQQSMDMCSTSKQC